MSTSPSSSNERATAKRVNIPTVLAAGCSDVLLARCWSALSGLGVMVRDCAPEELPTLAAARQPIAIVVPRAIYRADAAEIDALARDVNATLIQADEQAGGRDLEVPLERAVRTALRPPERRSVSGRYSILPGDPIPGKQTIPPISGVQPSTPGLDEIEEELLSVLG